MPLKETARIAAKPALDGAAAFRALGEPVRLHIVRMLADGERCACDLLANLAISQPTLSHHMKVLADAGLVVGRRDGLWVHYSLDVDAVASLSALVGGLATPAPDADGEGLSAASAGSPAARRARGDRKACCG